MEPLIGNTLQQFQELMKVLHQVSIALARAESIDVLLSQAVTLGHNQLGFDRMGIWILDEAAHMLHGTYGLDETGKLRDERAMHIQAVSAIQYPYDPDRLIMLNTNCRLLNDRSETVGYGWHATAGLWDGRRCIGFMSVDNLLSQEPISMHQLEILVLYGHTVGHYYTRLCENAEREQLLQREQRRTAELEALRITLSEMTQELDLSRLLQSITERITELYQATNGSIALYDGKVGDLEIVAIKSNHPNTRVGLRQCIGEGATGLTAQTRMLLNIEEYSSWNHQAAIHNSWKIGPALFAPLLLGEQLLGVISVSRDPGAPAFNADDERLLLHFAHQATIAIRNAQLYAEAQHMAMVDALTGLYNRRYCLDRITSEFARTKRNGKPTSIGLLDLDRFKQINDTHGHAVGDQVLREIARRLLDFVRAGDLIGRYGGEEFILLLPETESNAACEVAERLLRALAAIPIATEVGLLHITASIGLATYRSEHGTSIDEFLVRADANLYRAKDLGRNRVVS